MNKIQVLYKSIISSQRIKDHKEKIKLINDVVKFSASLYKDETTFNGEPYILKPLEIANICANELGLSYQSVCAVLLYHAVEKEKVKISEVEERIGIKASKIIEGRLR
ncbi:MAG: HD domain-containing protein, partial [Bacteroidales bacterium]|nr:HD domain-containing protein [Bacteroidales bacterium]